MDKILNSLQLVDSIAEDTETGTETKYQKQQGLRMRQYDIDLPAWAWGYHKGALYRSDASNDDHIHYGQRLKPGD